MYRKLIKPYHSELFAAIKARSRVRIFYHSDGNIYPLLNDLIETGIDLLNPVQVSAGDMGDTARLKREFGDRLAFCGAIDSQSVLPHGTVEDVRQEVRRRIKDLAPAGGKRVRDVRGGDRGGALPAFLLKGIHAPQRASHCRPEIQDARPDPDR
jgi:uroporphyrinogen decarboxylase